MVATFAINPITTTNALGSFGVSWDGFIQGTALDNPSYYQYLSGGVLATTETLPMWGGVGISESVNASNASTTTNQSLGNLITRATSLTATVAGGLTGFSVFDQNPAMVNFPQSPVPLAASGFQVNYYRLGSGARIAVACSPNILTDFQGNIISTQVSWDFTNQQLEPYVSATVSSGTYTSGTGAVSLTTSTAHGLQPGDTFLPALTGTGSFANLNVQQTATTGTTGTTLNFTAATGLTLTITGGSVSNNGALNVKVLDVNIGNSMQVVYNAGTGFATWNRSGNCAIILI